MRFYALRMQETGMIKSSSQHFLASGTDFRLLDEIKRDMRT